MLALVSLKLLFLPCKIGIIVKKRVENYFKKE